MNTMTQSHETHHQQEHHAVHGFGVVDRHGRQLGARVSLAIKTLSPGPRPGKYPTWLTMEPGQYFVWCGQATRAGHDYGAGQNWHYCTTREARDAEVAAYLKGARARAVKAAAKSTAKA